MERPFKFASKTRDDMCDSRSAGHKIQLYPSYQIYGRRTNLHLDFWRTRPSHFPDGCKSRVSYGRKRHGIGYRTHVDNSTYTFSSSLQTRV